MRCDEVQDLLEHYVAGGLAAKDREQTDLHLGGCEDCQKMLGRLQAMVGLLRSQPLPAAPEGFSDRVMAKAWGRVWLTPGSSAPIGPLRWWRAASLPMQAAAMLLLALGLVAGGFMGRDYWVHSEAGGDGEMARGRIAAEYNLDCLSEAPAGSLTDAYLRLALAGDRIGE